MNIAQTSKMTNIPMDILLRMRARDTRSILSGPPFHKVMGKKGEPIYEYKVKEIREWMRIKLCQVTAGDAANIMGVSRDEILAINGVQGFRIKNDYDGRLVVNNARNMYIWLPTKRKARKKNATTKHHDPS